MSENNNLLMIVAIIALCVALVNLGITINKIGDIREFTGYAIDTGTANLTITSNASIEFITDTINWGVGGVDETPTSAWMDSEGNVVDGDWTSVSQGLTLQNDGNCNVTFTLTTSKNAAEFIGGTAVTPIFEIKLTNNQSDSCCGTNSLSTYTTADKSAQQACDNFSFVDTADLLDIDVNITIPEDALPGAKGTVITATAECV